MKFRNLFLLAASGFGLWQWNRQRERTNATPIQNKVVIVTGASSGIGRATALAFAVQGAHTVLVARRANALAELQAEIQKKFNTRVLIVVADLSRQDEIDSVISETMNSFARIDVLVNNAGYRTAGPIESQDSNEVHKVLDLNLYAAIRLIQAVIPIMKEQKSGHIVNVSSESAIAFSPGQAAYGASKAGLNMFSDSIRWELMDNNIFVSTIMPGWTRTPMIEHVDVSQMPGVREGLIELQTPEYVASNIVAAVRYKKKRVQLGGIGWTLIALSERLTPELADWFYRYFYDHENIVESMETDN